MRDQGPSLIEAARYIERFRGKVVVVKLGGELLGDAVMARLAAQVHVLHRCGLRTVVVHGGGAQIDEACAARGITQRKVAGRRVTCEQTMQVVVDVVAGALNGALVEQLRQHDVPARGYADGLDTALSCTRRPPVLIEGEAGGEPVDFGQVGDVTGVDAALLEGALSEGVPVLPSIGRGEDGAPLNVNADTVAASVAIALGAQKLIMLSSVPGVMTSPDAHGPISQLDPGQARELIASGQVKGGMRAKVEEVLRAREGGVAQGHVIGGTAPHTLLREIFTDEGCGTIFGALDWSAP